MDTMIYFLIFVFGSLISLFLIIVEDRLKDIADELKKLNKQFRKLKHGGKRNEATASNGKESL